MHEFYRDNQGNRIIIKRGDGITMPEYYDGSKPPSFHVLSIEGNRINAKFSGSDENSIVKRGIRELAKKGIIVPEEEMRRIVHEGAEISCGNTHIEFPIKYEPFKYFPCFVKIAYETMRTLFPTYSTDPRSEELQHFLYTSIQDNYSNDFQCDDILANYSEGKPEYIYYAYFSVRDEKLYMDINLFNKVVMLIPVSNHPSSYYLEEYADVNLFKKL